MSSTVQEFMSGWTNSLAACQDYWRLKYSVLKDPPFKHAQKSNSVDIDMLLALNHVGGVMWEDIVCQGTAT